jgi:hypothetical protein
MVDGSKTRECGTDDHILLNLSVSVVHVREVDEGQGGRGSGFDAFHEELPGLTEREMTRQTSF